MVSEAGDVVSSDDGSLLGRFLKVYSNVPIEERKRVIVILDNGEPVSWEMAYREIKNDTPVGKTIGEKLINLKII